MARQIIQQIWCDVCIKHGEDDGQDPVYVEGAEVNITLGGLRMRTPAFCPVHEKEYIAPLEALLRDLPVAEVSDAVAPVFATDPKRREIECRICGRTLHGKASFGSHVRQMHDMQAAEYRQKYPDADMGGRPRARRGQDAEQLPLDESSQQQPSELVTEACSECGKTYSATPSRIRQVLGVHKAKTHGIKGATK